jgi:predicted Zn finger-like uncharacterized protein
MNKIIQCPACSTKFAIEEAQLSDVSNPKFHCSRCNTVFGIEDNSDRDLTEDTETQNSAEESLTDTSTQEETSPEPSSSPGEVSRENTTALDLLRSLKDQDNPESKYGVKPDKDHPAPKNPDSSWKIDDNDHTVDTFSNKPSSRVTVEEHLHGDNPLADESQLSLFSKDETSQDIDLTSDTDELQNLQGITASWENTNPDRPYEADLGARKTSTDSSSTSVTRVMRRDTLSDTRLPAKVTSGTTSDLSAADKKDSPGKNLNELFKSGVRNVISKNTPDDTPSSSGKYLPVPASKPVSDSGTYHTKSEQDPGDIPLRKIRSELEKEALHSTDTNRSMMDTTVIKRDSLDTSIFSMIDENPDDTSDPGELIPQVKRITHKKSIFPFFRSASVSFSNIPPLRRPAFSNISGIGKSFVIAWSVPFCMMLFLIFWANNFSYYSTEGKNKNSLGKLLWHTLGLSEPLPVKIPPQGLSFNPRDARVTPVQDSDWILIRGSILNTSNYSVPEVKISVFFYDHDNNLLSRRNSLLPNEFHNLDIGQISDAELREALKKSSQRNFPPNSSVHVAFAFPDSSSDEEWFAARIHSVIY